MTDDVYRRPEARVDHDDLEETDEERRRFVGRHARLIADDPRFIGLPASVRERSERVGRIARDAFVVAQKTLVRPEPAYVAPSVSSVWEDIVSSLNRRTERHEEEAVIHGVFGAPVLGRDEISLERGVLMDASRTETLLRMMSVHRGPLHAFQLWTNSRTFFLENLVEMEEQERENSSWFRVGWLWRHGAPLVPRVVGVVGSEP